MYVVHGNLGVLLLKQGKFEEGWRHLTKALQLMKGERLRSVGYNCAAFCLYVLKDKELAMEVCEHIAFHDNTLTKK